MTHGRSEGDATDPVVTTVGNSFDVVFDELPGSGHRWTLRAVPRALTLVSEGWADPMPQSVGASRGRRFTFRADEPGDCQLRFVLRRPWETEGAGPAPKERTVPVRIGSAETAR
jgi:predicted secreted protein